MDVDLIGWEACRVFHQVALQGSFSRAAAELHLTQSAVSQSVRHLEDRLQTRLLHRQPRQVALTEEGKILYDHVDQARLQLQTALRKIQEVQNLEAGQLRLGAGDTICRYFLLPRLQEYAKKYPQIRLHLINRTSMQLLELLKNGAIDMAVTTLPLEEKGLPFIPFLPLQDIFVASSRFSRLKGRKITLAELSRQPLLLLEKTSSTRRILDRHLAEKGIELNPEMELESVDLIVQLARQGMGVGHVLKEAAEEYLEKEELFSLQIREKLPLRSLGVVTSGHLPLPLAAQRMGELLQSRQ